MIIEKLKSETWNVSKPSAFHASDAGTLCPRYHYHVRADWQRRPTPPDRVRSILELGKELEGWVIRRLQEAGVQVIMSQVRMYDADLDISGAVDLLARMDNGQEIVIEIKSTSQWAWEKINSYQDLLTSGHWYVRWAAQLPLYLYLNSLDFGLYLLVNKQTGEIKEIPVTLDEAMPLLTAVQEVLGEAKRALKTGRIPAPSPRALNGEPYPALCSECWVRQVGLCPGLEPEGVSGDVDMIALAEAVSEVIAHRDSARAYDKALEAVKAITAKLAIKNGERRELLAGPGVVRVSSYETSRYDIPKEIKEQFRRVIAARRVEVL